MKRFPIISAGFLGRYSALIGKFPLKGPNHRLYWEGGVGAVNGGIDRRRGSRVFFRPQRFEEYG